MRRLGQTIQKWDGLEFIWDLFRASNRTVCLHRFLWRSDGRLPLSVVLRGVDCEDCR